MKALSITGVRRSGLSLRIRRKLSCDCKAFYESGWLCAHVLASLNLIDKFNLPLLVKSVPARKPPGRPRKAPKTLHSKDPYNGQYSIDKLIDKLTNHPGSVIGWKVLTKHDTTDSRGDTTTRQRTGVIRPWVEEEERYYWEIELDRRADEASVPDVKVDIQQLAEVINFTYRARYPFV
ncbi:hypothetical protein PF007_g1866 [Phytophthora fragariae]|uniref:SWIM-type domain-containing protein n=3 Tax=Phytophthora fragariae TaxID=53985 RepID=A0A6A3TIC1_9STRA|nr:hypothetical protein PF009_g1802 [Phytophthora fragariae]KAE9137202.1 hypothetical protein PF007_g1866 [Phytophthora fragariae]KAE9165825.1 hypothetical protein PF004_g29370 [Phytophthora fragariae]